MVVGAHGGCMDRTERLYKIDQLLRNRRVVPINEFLSELEISKATFRRDLEVLRDRLNAPIVWDRKLRGYRFDTTSPDGPRYQLPGLWFNGAETHALLTFYHLLDKLQPNLLKPHIKPLQSRIQALLKKGDHSFAEIAHRIRVLPLGARPVEVAHFETIAHALLKRRRLTIIHYSRSRDEESEREISPQRLAYYRDNWYLDAWCHKQNGLRTFAMDTIRQTALTDKKARNVSDKTLEAELGAGYGIFAGRKTQIAKLRFTPERARWVAWEQWHPDQKARFEDGYYILEIPYSDDRELLMDIMKHGPEVDVLAPKSLRTRVLKQLQLAVSNYEK